MTVDDGELARFLEESQDRLVRIGDGFAVGTELPTRRRSAPSWTSPSGRRDPLARFRDLLGISRKPAQLLLERFDADGLTRRIGDERVLRRGATIDR